MDKQNLLSVVVADDEQELLGAVCQLIDWAGIGFKLVGRASNGLDALQLVEELQPDFLLTDIHMPFISGTALAVPGQGRAAAHSGGVSERVRRV